MSVRPKNLRGGRAPKSGLAWTGLALLIGATAQAQVAAQKSQIDAFVAQSGLPRNTVVSVKPDIVVAMRDHDAVIKTGANGKIRLRGEVVDEETAERLGYRSMRSTVEVNCETRRDRVVEMEIFSSHNLKGDSRRRTLPGGWVQPSEDAYMADVVRAACRLSTPSQPQPKSEPPPKPPGPAPMSKPAPAPSQQVALKRLTVPAPQALARKDRLEVQIGALDTTADAKRAVAQLSGLIAPPLATEVLAASHNGRTFYRAVVTGFLSRAEAIRFCDKVTLQGGRCFIR